MKIPWCKRKDSVISAASPCHLRQLVTSVSSSSFVRVPPRHSDKSPCHNNNIFLQFEPVCLYLQSIHLMYLRWPLLLSNGFVVMLTYQLQVSTWHFHCVIYNVHQFDRRTDFTSIYCTVMFVVIGTAWLLTLAILIIRVTKTDRYDQVRTSLVIFFMPVTRRQVIALEKEAPLTTE